MKVKTDIGRFEFLREEQIDRIHKESIDLLENMGVKVFNAKLISRLKKAGVRVDGDIVKFSKKDIEYALNSVKGEFTLYGYGDAKNIDINRDTKFIRNHANAVQYFDFKSRILRDSKSADITNMTKVAEASELIEVITPACTATDLKENQMLVSAKNVLLNTSKPIELAPHNTEEFVMYLDIDSIIRGNNSFSKPRFDVVISTTSPFELDNDSCENLMLCTEKGLPVHTAPCPMGGSTSPFTLAGTLLLVNAESLFLLACTQVLNPGNPVIRGSAASAMDLRNATVAYGSAERALIIGANAQLARWYNLQSATPAGSVDAWEMDIQQGLQKMLAFITRAFSRGTLFATVGGVNNGLAVSCEQILIDLEMIKMIIRITEGINFEDDATALDVIKSVGHGGNYLTEDHTINWLSTRKEHTYMDLVNVEGPTGLSMIERANIKVQSILNNNKAIYSDSTIEEVEKYVSQRIK